MKIQENTSLKKYNTFGIEVQAKKIITIETIAEIQEVLKQQQDYYILSGGSNILLTKDITKTIIYINNKGIKIKKETKKAVYIKANAGENWHQFVQWSIQNNYGGIENLSLIPGKVGTTPIQNIGAYGVEVKDTIHKVKAIEIKTGKKVKFKNKECNFGYRNSIFKNKEKGKYIITSVTYKLTKNKHKLHYEYGAIKTELLKHKIEKPTIQDISNAIIKIRQQKLPDPKEIGNSGSFFKNPVVTEQAYKKVKAKNETMPSYKVNNNSYKIPAGWLIEQSGYKGKRYGDAGVHKNQALVLVNYGKASGKDILKLAKKIQETVKTKFGIVLEMEVNIV